MSYLASFLLLAHVQTAQSSSPPVRRLQIVVVDGESAVNVVQQRTAVAPVVEVHDRNNEPIAGAVVRFVIRSGRATFGGARTLSVATDSAGRAAATGLTPTSPGAVQISATATFQGQTASATIVQTNIMTTTGATTSAASAGNAAQGGVSGNTLGTIGGIAGGAVAGGVALEHSLHESTPPPPITYSSPFSGQLISQLMYFGAPCAQTWVINGTLTVTVDNEKNGVFNGQAHFAYTLTGAGTTPSTCNQAAGTATFDQTIQFSGPADHVSFSKSSTTTPGAPGIVATVVDTISFEGVSANQSVDGTVTLARTVSSVPPEISGGGTAVMPATLR